MSYIIVIPARYASSRLPGKPLRIICGKSMIQRVFEQAQKSNAERVIVATDDLRIQEIAQGFGARVCMTCADHPSGTDRLQEVASQLKFADDQVIVNVQGDEPLLPPENIDQVAKLLLDNPAAGIATLSVPIQSQRELFDPNVVKVVTDRSGAALYFSRAAVPWMRDAFANANANTDNSGATPLPQGYGWQRHIGIYAYRVAFLHQYIGWEPADIERCEALEQLRALWNGVKIQVAVAKKAPPAGVDTEEDLLRIQSLLSGNASE